MKSSSTRIRLVRRDDGVETVELVADEPDELIEGEPFGKYLLVGELAVGGMAEVYLAVQHGMKGYLKVVTIKRMLPALGRSADYVAMFVDEARLGARLEHPNIVRTYEFGEIDGQFYTAMEYLPGEDLSKLLKRAAASKQPIPLNIAVHLIMQTCNGLHFAHELTDTDGRPLGLVHRDVNPSNIVITYGGEVKVIDFGVAKSNDSATHTMSGTIKGKLAYMAPEQVLGGRLDRRTDVFSVGVVLWELITAQPLFRRDNEAATIYAILHDPVPSVRKLRPEVPRELDEMVLRALARDPEERFETCEHMMYALESFIGTLPKIDARVLALMLEATFGSTRASAKRAIAQARSLRANVSQVMKLRTDVRRDIATSVDAMQRELEASRAHERPRRGPARLAAVAGVALILIAAALAVVFTRSRTEPQHTGRPPARATLALDSTPRGAAILIASEPTGRNTPASFADLDPGAVKVRLELAGHGPFEGTVVLEAGRSATVNATLVATSGRLVLAGLPADAQLWVDRIEVVVGEVVPLVTGRHEIRIEMPGARPIEQVIETMPGDDVWELRGTTLVRRAP